MKLIIVGTSEPSIYSMSTKKDVTKLYYSKFDNWTPKCSGKVAAKLTDTGNNVVIECAHPLAMELDYSEAFELYLILRSQFGAEPIRDFKEVTK
jgi:hypothetical protein